MTSTQPAPVPAPDEATDATFVPAPPRIRLALAVGGAGLLALLLLGGVVFATNQLSWVHRAPLSDPIYGINYDCNHAEFLFLEDPALGPAGYVSDDRPGRAEWCAQNFAEVLEATGAKHARISIAWRDVEPAEGEYDFRVVDQLLAAAEAHDARVLLTVGMRGLRHPEFYIPNWAADDVHMPEDAVVSDDPLLRARALRMVEAVVRHIAESPVIEAWGAENEPYVPSKRANWWRLGRDYVQEVAATLRAADPQGRPVVINQAQRHLRDTYPAEREWILEDADVMGISFYPYRDHPFFGVDVTVPIAELGWIHPNYAAHQREAADAGLEYWITELQGEPWAHVDPRLISPERPSQNLSPRDIENVVRYGRRTGAQRIYFWGAEWWLYQELHFGDARWLEAARPYLAGAEPGAITQSP